MSPQEVCQKNTIIIPVWVWFINAFVTPNQLTLNSEPYSLGKYELFSKHLSQFVSLSQGSNLE